MECTASLKVMGVLNIFDIFKKTVVSHHLIDRFYEDRQRWFVATVVKCQYFYHQCLISDISKIRRFSPINSNKNILDWNHETELRLCIQKLRFFTFSNIHISAYVCF